MGKIESGLWWLLPNKEVWTKESGHFFLLFWEFINIFRINKGIIVKRSFQEEFIDMLNKYGVEDDKNYI